VADVWWVWWVLLFVVIALGGLAVLVLVGLRVWRSARGLLAELDVAAVRAGELADLLAQIEVPGVGDPVARTATDVGSELTPDDGWPGTVRTYDDVGANAPGKKES
jgi:hypothetical protein